MRCQDGVASCWVGLLVRPVWVSWLSLGGQVLQVVCCHCWGACSRCPVVRFLLLSFGLHPTRLKHGSLAHSTCVAFSAHLCWRQLWITCVPGSALVRVRIPTSPGRWSSQSRRCRHCISVCYQLPSLCSLRGWWPRSNGLRTAPFCRPRPRVGARPLDGATISVQEVRQPGLCNCPVIAVSVTLPLKTWHIVFRSARGSRICERSGA